ncbi:phosphotransferase family protein [Streptomyces radiopugnans]|uniref:Predicted kinase, aminoglycoside phosphotransferase (APT) family n=1 Tax=Streptomyces radiopugnans TaxID=403935 RepID=A0A1H9F7D2_9ACTN|nr:phosphotransferase family protein [Streptomyces radiopugnans]SEQ33842.1 Predicted kinase, aminoglycoside phosphotransferase (APT) family [Streptomyces radiopugnans]
MSRSPASPEPPGPPASRSGRRAVRAEDAFDVARVDAWLKERLDGLTGTPEVTQFSGGASNLTYLLRYPGAELVLRRPPAGRKASSAHDMAREYRVQERLRPVFPYVPAVRALCRDPEVIGGDFYVMDRVPGLILRGRLPEGLTLDRARARRLSETFVDTLADLHRVDARAAGLGDLGRGTGYVRRQVEGWTRRYAQARTWNTPRFGRVTSWLADNRPDDVATCVIHNDWRLDNIVLDPGDLRVTGVLDWEMATLGDPLMDLGSALAYWVQADDDRIARATRRQPSHLPGMLTRAEIVERYRERTGLPVGDWTFYEVFGLFRLAAIAQQIYYRYHHGQTRNPAFRNLWLAVHYLDRRCRRAIARAGR